MHRRLRLHRKSDFDAVFKRARSWHNELLVLRSLPNSLDHHRVGFITSKKLGKAVIRNRVRRRLREAVRALPLVAGWDIVVSAKAPAGGADYHQLNQALTDLLAKAHLLDSEASA